MKFTKRKEIDELTYQINSAAITVHKQLGRGLLETVYQQAMIIELDFLKIRSKSEVKVDFDYRGKSLTTSLRCDLLVEDSIVLELKACKLLLPIHEAQLLTYMELLKVPKGIIYNFHALKIMGHGQLTRVNKHFSKLL